MNGDFIKKNREVLPPPDQVFCGHSINIHKFLRDSE